MAPRLALLKYALDSGKRNKVKTKPISFSTYFIGLLYIWQVAWNYFKNR